MNIAPYSNYMYWPNDSSSHFPVYPMSIGHYVNQPAIKHDGHIWNEFHWVTKGAGTYNIEGKNITLSEGSGIFMRSNFKRSYKSADAETPFSTSWVAFTGGDELLDLYDIADYKVFKFPSSIQKRYDDILSVCESGGSEAQRAASCYYFIVELLESINRQERNIPMLIEKYLNNNYNKNITINDVADEIRMSKYSLYRYLKKNNLESIANQLKHIRILKAKDLLKTTNHPANDIGNFCGFESPSYFGKVFKEEAGMTPLEYREKQKK